MSRGKGRRQGRHTPNQQAQHPTKLQRTETYFEYSGPIPPPSVLKKYDEVCPGLSETLISEFKAQAEHRREIQSCVIGGNVRAQLTGQWMAFFLGLGALGFGAYLAYLGQTGWGIAVAIGSIAGLLGTFFRQSKGQDAARERQRNSIHGPPDQSN